MDKDYANFVARMGSFDDDIDIEDKTSNELKHYGVLGMKWGRRKGVNSQTISAAAKTGQSLANFGQTSQKTGYSRKALKDAKKLSDDELKQLTSRLELENRYMNASIQQSGKNKVESILSVAGAALGVASSAAVAYDAIKKSMV